MRDAMRGARCRHRGLVVLEIWVSCCISCLPAIGTHLSYAAPYWNWWLSSRRLLRGSLSWPLKKSISISIAMSRNVHRGSGVGPCTWDILNTNPPPSNSPSPTGFQLTSSLYIDGPACHCISNLGGHPILSAPDGGSFSSDGCQRPLWHA